MKQYGADRVKVSDGFWHTLEKLGITRQAIARHTHLPSATLLNQVAPTTEQFFTLWESLPALSGDPAIGFEFAKSIQASQLPPELFAASLAKDYRGALNRVARFKRLCAPELIDIKESGGFCTIAVDWLNTNKPTPDALVDTTFTFLLGLGSENSGRSIHIGSVLLTRARPDTDYLQSYYGDNIQFGGDKNAITLDSALLDSQLDTYNQALSDMLLPQLESELAADKDRQTYAHQVKWVIEQHLSSGSPQLALVAKELGVSVRTLQRRITSEGHTYKELLNQVRLSVAKNYLSESAMSLNEIAALLGYEDQNSFYRAFKMREGNTPSSWRDNNRSFQRPV